MAHSSPYRMTLCAFGLRRLAVIVACLVCGLMPAGGLWAGEAGPIVQQAQQQLAIAIQQAEVSLQSHQPGSGHTKQHMQQVLNVLEGRNGQNFNAKVGNPGDGEGVTKYLELAEEKAKAGQGSSDLQQAFEQTKTLVQEAIQHAKLSVQGGDVHETHKQAGLAVGLLVALAGRQDSDSPITGGLAYLAKKTGIHGESDKGRD